MYIVNGILLILTGLGAMGFGLMLFAVVGAGITLAVFDTFIVVASAIGGAGLAMDGIHLIFRSLDIFDRSTIANGAVVPLIIWVVAGAIAMGWQFMNLERWTGAGTIKDTR